MEVTNLRQTLANMEENVVGANFGFVTKMKCLFVGHVRLQTFVTIASSN